MNDHKHQWSKPYKRWLLWLSSTTRQYTEYYVEGSTPVWVKECIICATVRHHDRKWPTKLAKKLGIHQ